MAIIGLDLGHGKNTFPPSKGVYRNGEGYAEYDANSRVGRQLKAKLEAAGHTVVMAQPFNSNDVVLSRRTSIYFSRNVDLIISLHANYNSNSDANGYAAFYWYNHADSKKLADLYEEELVKHGFKLWGGSRPSRPNDWSNFHMCRVPAQRGVPSILAENGFMGNARDFEWIFGSKKNEYAEKVSEVAFNAIQRYLGESTDVKVESAPKEETASDTVKKSISQMASEVIAGKHGNGHANRRRSLGISASEYEKVRAEVNRRSGVSSNPKPSKPSKPSKSIAQMVQEVIDGKHGNGHTNRRKSLGISQAEYNKVRAEVNKRLSSGGSSPSRKSISQMASEVIAGKHGNGHANRRRSLGISQSEYEKVRAEVNKRS
jgi:N-acetylmuramoyl-L-alanine amidase